MKHEERNEDIERVRQQSEVLLAIIDDISDCEAVASAEATHQNTELAHTLYKGILESVIAAATAYKVLKCFGEVALQAVTSKDAMVYDIAMKEVYSCVDEGRAAIASAEALLTKLIAPESTTVSN